MGRIFGWIGKIIERNPIKIFLGTVLLFGILIIGALNVNMATGNETLVKADNEVYKSNKIMEENFGGDSIIVLFEGATTEEILSVNNIEKMWNIEQRFKYEENIFSMMSTASIVHQMTEMQSEKIKEQILTISDGLGDMSEKMIEIGSTLGSKDIKDPQEIKDKLSNLSKSTEAFNKLILGQNNLTEGATQLQGGLSNASEGLKMASIQLKELGNLAGDNMELKMKLNTLSENISKSAIGLMTMSEKTSMIKDGTANTANALTNVSNQLTEETSSMTGGLDGGISPDELKEMAAGFVTMGEKLGDISEGLELFHNKSEMMVANIPTTQEELDNLLYDEDLELRSIFSDVIVDPNHSVMIVKLQGNLGDEYKDAIYQDISTALEEEGFKDLSYIVSGKPVLDSSLRSEMKVNMKVMVAMAVALMFVILLLVFKIRWRILSLGIIFVSVIATLGFMGTINVPMTMVSMAVFPILIGLGIDYSIQFQNRYEEEKSAKVTLAQIGKAVAIAVLATVLGFISLYASPVPMIQDFGKMLTIGVFISFIGSVFLLMPILYLRDTFDKQTNRKVKVIDDKPTVLDKMLQGSAKFVVKYSIIVIAISIVIAAFGVVADRKVGVETDIETFMPQDMVALNDIHRVRDIVGSTNQMAIYMESDNILTEENKSWMKNTIKEIEDRFDDIVVDIKSIDTVVSNIAETEDISHSEYIDMVNSLPKSQSKMFLNEEQNKSVILLNIKHLPTDDLQIFVNELKGVVSDADMTVHVTGKSVLDVEMVDGLTSGRIKMTLIGIGLVFVVLLFIYRNIVKAFIPVFPIVLIVGMSGGIMYLLGLKYTPITATLGALVLGMGTEMTIMLLERYLEERKSGKEKLESMLITVTMIGKATVASGLTTVGGFSVLMASKFVILKDFGLMTVINVSLALMSTFIILPAVIIILDRFIVSKKEIEEGKEIQRKLTFENK
ncbi:hydrophobe/amphiphile efflux-3 (HAE3) family transporter [Tissierella sp.]|uniref:hydrophobe/amphiphile efflux-3 (HAE3) family transporter n=1 Tax=Tissierella sp. TaxID=41274 RepID=UPI00285650C1|nr:hydrophobe/amphiphile efflux-3 (HAE3) family transporter [Tissierella sp.]MDR7857034.1 hydrophobe/amphiphile efflux-3 (HAE3) family transporter [Tissierella sp.]